MKKWKGSSPIRVATGGLAASDRITPPKINAMIAASNSRSTVHRPAYLDYVGVKTFDAAGEVVGERRFLGLFTSAAYNESIQRIPVLRRKAAQPRRTFVRTTVVLAAISLAAPFLLPLDAASIAGLVVAHVIAAAVVIPAVASRLR